MCSPLLDSVQCLVGIQTTVGKRLGGDEKRLHGSHSPPSSTHSSPGSCLSILKIPYPKRFPKHTASKENRVLDLYRFRGIRGRGLLAFNTKDSTDYHLSHGSALQLEKYISS